MVIPTGLAAQLGIKDESTHGTAVVVDRFYEIISAPFALNIERMESAGLRAGTRVLRSDRWVAGAKSVTGTINMEIANKSFGLWLKHMFGTIASAQPDSGGSPTVWEHTATPGDLPVGLTIQVGVPDETGTVQPFTYEGCMVDSWEIEATVGEIGKVTVSIDAEDEKTATALASASYPTGLTLLTFVEATLDIAGSEVDVKSFSVAGSNSLATDRGKLGSALRKKPSETAQREYTGSVDAYFSGLTDYTRFVAGTEAALVATFIGVVINGAFNYELELTMNVRFDGDTPTVDGPDEIMQPLTFKCLDTGAGPSTAITAVYRTTDTTP